MWKKLREKQRNRQECTTAAAVVRILGGKFLEVHKAAKKGKVLVFHWRGGYLTKEVLNELLDLIRKAGMEKEKNAMVSINWPQAVLRVQYADIQVQESVMLEEANEGEKD